MCILYIVQYRYCRKLKKTETEVVVARDERGKYGEMLVGVQIAFLG